MSLHFFANMIFIRFPDHLCAESEADAVAEQPTLCLLVSIRRTSAGCPAQTDVRVPQMGQRRHERRHHADIQQQVTWSCVAKPCLCLGDL